MKKIKVFHFIRKKNDDRTSIIEDYSTFTSELRVEMSFKEVQQKKI